MLTVVRLRGRGGRERQNDQFSTRPLIRNSPTPISSASSTAVFGQLLDQCDHEDQGEGARDDPRHRVHLRDDVPDPPHEIIHHDRIVAARFPDGSHRRPRVRRLESAHQPPPEVVHAQESTPPLVTTQRDGHVLLIGVNRSDKRNAFNLAVIDQFAAAYEMFADDADLRAAVVFGHGDHFSAGLDLAEVGPAVAEKGPGALGGGRRYDPFGMWAPQVSKPVVMAVQGIAFTLSIELALASDIVVAADDVRFRQLEIGRGIMPFGGATIRAPLRLGWGNAMRFLLHGTGVRRRRGVAHRIGARGRPAGQQLQRATEIAQVIAEQAPLGVQAASANARIAEAQGIDAAKRHLVEQLGRVLASKDAQEGVMSFLERREARFTGE